MGKIFSNSGTSTAFPVKRVVKERAKKGNKECGALMMHPHMFWACTLVW